MGWLVHDFWSALTEQNEWKYLQLLVEILNSLYRLGLEFTGEKSMYNGDVNFKFGRDEYRLVCVSTLLINFIHLQDIFMYIECS